MKRFASAPFLHAVLLSALLMTAAATAAVIDDEVDISGTFLQMKLSPDDGGVISTLRLLDGSPNMAGPAGLLLEGFGVPSHYVPNRRLNEKMEALDEYKDRPVLRFSYDCEGPNIEGLHVTRVMEPVPDEGSMRVTWIVENKGKEAQWIAPWVGGNVRPGGAMNAEDRIDLPSRMGVVRASRTAYHSASRNWIAATDPAAQESFFSVFNADQTHSFLTIWDEESVDRGFQAAFVPTLLKPGATWKTVYRLGMVRGLKKVDFATDELAMELDYTPGQLVALIASVKPLRGVHIEARIVAENGRVWKLPRKKFDIEPGKVIRCTYPWDAPADGHYDFMAQLIQDGITLPLGTDTASPHGGIDTRFAVGGPAPRVMDAWTDAPYQLDRGPRTLKRAMVQSGDRNVWIEPALEKVFREDKAVAQGPNSSLVPLGLARGERESFQICLRPEKQPMIHATVKIADLVHSGGGARIPAADITLNDVRWLNVRIPSHFEGPTGMWPDALPPHKPLLADAGLITPIWVTIHAKPGLPAGIYRSEWRVTADGEPDIPITVEARVFDFDLPATPRLRTDFGYWEEAAVRGSRAAGGKGDAAALTRAYLENALEHRVTLRDPLMLDGNAQNMRAKLPLLRAALEKGASVVPVSPDILDNPEKLAAANQFVVSEKLQEKAFVPLSYEPLEPGWPQLLEAINRWKTAAPAIPVQVSTLGLRPFLPDVVDLWCVHLQVMDTPNSLDILKRAAAGREIWWYVSHTPPRPYGNLFVDFSAVEHRILFWQAWALGMRGMQYWNINYIPEGQDPQDELLDATPVNGDGVLVYPGPDGPVNSIRWETVRDGLEDYDYFSVFMELREALSKRGGNEALLKQAAAVYNLEKVVPSLVTFPRDSGALLQKRGEVAAMIEEMGRALKNAPPPRLEPSTPAEPAPAPQAKPAAVPAPPAPDMAPATPPPAGPAKNFGPAKK